MRTIYTSILFIAFMGTCFAQNAPIDFEPDGFGADWTWTTFENEDNPTLEIITNPDFVGNPSSTVAQFTARANGAPFAGCESQIGSDIGTFSLTAETSTISIKVWKNVQSNVGIKLVDSTLGSLGEILVPNSATGAWEELTFDFSSMVGIEYAQIVIFPDFRERDAEEVIFFDDIRFSPAVEMPSPMVAAPDPTQDPANVISLFSGVYTDVPVSTFITPWSEGFNQAIEIESNETQLYTSLNFIGIETVDDNLIDISEMDFVHLDVWTPNMTELRFKLVDFGADMAFDGGDDTEHEIIFSEVEQGAWIPLNIPLDQFTGLTGRENLAQYILAGNPVGQGILYVDNLYFYSQPNSLSELNGSIFNMYPNPATTQVRIETEQEIVRYTIYDVRGRQVQSGRALQNVIETQALNSGTYLLELETQDGLARQRLIIR